MVSNVKCRVKASPRAVPLELRAYMAALMRVNVWHRKWLDDRRRIHPAPLDKRYQEVQPEILISASREATFAK
jgi:hypothetical protein